MIVFCVYGSWWIYIFKWHIFFSADQSFSLGSLVFIAKSMWANGKERKKEKKQKKVIASKSERESEWESEFTHNICFCGLTFFECCGLWFVKVFNKIGKFSMPNKMFPPQNQHTHTLTFTNMPNVQIKYSRNDSHLQWNDFFVLVATLLRLSHSFDTNFYYRLLFHVFFLLLRMCMWFVFEFQWNFIWVCGLKIQFLFHFWCILLRLTIIQMKKTLAKTRQNIRKNIWVKANKCSSYGEFHF